MQVEPFTALARVYDAIMADIEYDDWGEFILNAVTARGWAGGRLLDFGCGTGNATFPMFARGFDVIGLDASAAMLRVAREKLPTVEFVEAGFTTFEVDATFTLVYSVFDSLNNLLDPADFVATARRVLAHLEPGGYFMFDVNTTTGLRDLWESGRAEGWAGDVYYRWDHSFDERTGLARVEAYCETLADSFTEVHFERPYDPPELRALLSEAGFEAIEVIVYPSGRPAGDDAVRVWVMASKPSG